MEKADFRREARARAKRLTPEERMRASRSIAEQVFALPAWRQAGTVMAYSALPTEPDTREIILRAAAEKKIVLLPRCLQAPRMLALPWRGDGEMEPGYLGIPEPRMEAGAELRPDLILIPCVAAARDGIRLGHGAGYYDWFLKEQQGTKVCLCFSALLFDELPAEEWDIRMDRVISDLPPEKGI